MDVGSIAIAAGAFGTVTVSALIVLLVELVKAYWPDLSGRRAEIAVTCVSVATVVVVLLSTRADWLSRDTWIALAVGTVSVNVLARSIYTERTARSAKGGDADSVAELSKVDTG